MLEIKNLTVSVDDKTILKDFNLTINDGEIVALMGPNGIGKSTICKVIMGDSRYKVEEGSINYNGENLLNMDTTTRARKGIYLVSQNPIEIPGVSNADMLRCALEERTGERSNFFEFNKKVMAICSEINLNPDFIHRGVNENMSGGEKKKNELLHLYTLEPTFIMLDELDSGLDVDALNELATSLNKYLKENISILVITHHTSILEYLKPNTVHILKDGHIVASGDATLANTIEENGFKNYE